MNNTQKLIASTAIGAVVAASTAFYLHGSRNATIERFPYLDPQVAKEAYKRMIRKTLKGEYGDIQHYTLEQMDSLFLDEVRLLNQK